jgi:hypothetical protein
LHETGHAVIEQLKVPVLGREEDAADTFAAVNMLRMEHAECQRMLAGAAWAYGHDAEMDKLDQTDFSDTHSLDAQRYYNLLCMAYGRDTQFFGGLVARGLLPKERAVDCVAEYKQAYYAVQKLLMPTLAEAQWSPPKRAARGPHSVHQ